MTKATCTAGHVCSPFGDACADIVTLLSPTPAAQVDASNAQIACGAAVMPSDRPGIAAAFGTAINVGFAVAENVPDAGATGAVRAPWWRTRFSEPP